jgi:hypothetical protein
MRFVRFTPHNSLLLFSQYYSLQTKIYQPTEFKNHIWVGGVSVITALRKMRLDSNLTMEIVAANANMNLQTYAQKDRGRRRIYPKDAKQLAPVFGCSPKELMGMVDEFDTPEGVTG